MDADKLQHLNEILTTKQKRLRVLEKQEAQFGFRTDPSVLNEIDEIRTEIARVEKEIASLKKQDVIDLNSIDFSLVDLSKLPYASSETPQLSISEFLVHPASKDYLPKTLQKLVDKGFSYTGSGKLGNDLNFLAIAHRDPDNESWKFSSMVYFMDIDWITIDKLKDIRSSASRQLPEIAAKGMFGFSNFIFVMLTDIVSFDAALFVESTNIDISRRSFLFGPSFSATFMIYERSKNRVLIHKKYKDVMQNDMSVLYHLLP